MPEVGVFSKSMHFRFIMFKMKKLRMASRDLGFLFSLALPSVKQRRKKLDERDGCSRWDIALRQAERGDEGRDLRGCVGLAARKELGVYFLRVYPRRGIFPKRPRSLGQRADAE